VPDAPTNLANDAANTKGNQISVTWVAPAFNGGSPVLDYSVWYDNAAGGEYTQIASGITSLSYIATSLTQGKTYRFKIKARNVYGFSVLSSFVAILASQKPGLPVSPTTTFLQASNIVLVTWTEPDNGGSPITGYIVSIRQNDL
jgi:hypothetical protein